MTIQESIDKSGRSGGRERNWAEARDRRIKSYYGGDDWRRLDAA